VSDLLTVIRTTRSAQVALAGVGIALLAGGLIVMRPAPPEDEEQTVERRLFIDVKRAISGQKLRLDNDDDEYLILAGN